MSFTTSATPSPIFRPAYQIKTPSAISLTDIAQQQQYVDPFNNGENGDDDDDDDYEDSQESVAPSPKPITENPFDSESSRILFDAIDQLQSCGANSDVDIPQLVIVGGQSTGKSSLLQSLTDIPFPVGDGCCTRFATRIISRRTPANSQNQFKITIVDPEVEVHAFGYATDESYKEYLEAGEVLDADTFARVMGEVTLKYMGIKPGQGRDKKNFASEVLRIELSGPARSHFSILDVPGVIQNSIEVNQSELEGVEAMVEGYMKKPENIVICVIDAVTDFANQVVFKMAVEHVDKKRMVGVFTKCDIVPTMRARQKLVDIAKGKNVGESTHDGWFVVRNRTEEDKENPNFDLAEEEACIFNADPWKQLRRERRGTDMLRKYLSNLLCARIRDNFPRILEQINIRLEEAKTARRGLGDARPTHKDRLKWLRDIVQDYERLATISLENPGFLEEKMRVRSKVADLNREYTVAMGTSGHTHDFEDPDLDPVSFWNELKAERAAASVEENDPDMPVTGMPTTLSTPPPSSRKRNSMWSASSVRFQQMESDSSAEDLFAEIRQKMRDFQCTVLPGFPNPAVIPALYQMQTQKWDDMARHHVQRVADHVAKALGEILRHVCPVSSGFNIAREELEKSLCGFYAKTLRSAQLELDEYIRREKSHMLSADNSQFKEKLQAHRLIRVSRSCGILKPAMSSLALDHQMMHMHHAFEENMVHDVHDALKLYYQMSIETFTRHVTHIIAEGLVSSPDGPLKALCKDWVYSLSEEEVLRLAREDDETISERAEYDASIERLFEAKMIAQRAREGTVSLGAM